MLLGFLFILGLSAALVWAWNLNWTQRRWEAYLGQEAYGEYVQGVERLKAGNVPQAQTHFETMFHLLLNSSPTPTPIPPGFGRIHLLTLMPPATPASVQATPAPPSTATPPITPSPTPIPTPSPHIQATVTAWLQEAEALAQADPCAAAERMAQVLALADTPDIERRRQELMAQCQEMVSPSPLPTPAASQVLLYTVYDVTTGYYAIHAWTLGQRTPGAPFIPQAMQPAWGMHGEIAFRRDDVEAPGLYVRFNDGEIRRITKGGDDSRPRWSPDGRQLLFSSSQRSADQSPRLYLVDVASRSVEELGPGQQGDWSRDGRIVFHGCESGGENCGLWLLDPMTLQRTQLTDNPSDHSPTWSPDGRLVAFMSGGRSNSWDVFILDVQAGIVMPTTLHPAEDGLPVWSPDGRTLGILSNREGDWAIYLWHLDDLTTERLLPVGPTLPNWQQAGFDWGVVVR